MITVTDTAKKQALRLMDDEGSLDSSSEWVLKEEVALDLCPLTFDNEKKEGDSSFQDNGIEVVVDKKSYLYLLGTTLDFSGGLNGKGLYLKTQMPIGHAGVENLFQFNKEI